MYKDLISAFLYSGITVALSSECVLGFDNEAK